MDTRLPFWRFRRRTLLIVGCALVLGLLVSFTTGFSGSEVCGNCGKRREYRKVRLGLSGPPILTVSQKESDSLLSRFFAVETPKCSHRWLFAAGGNYGVVLPARSCAIGSGRHLWKAIEATNVVVFLTDLRKQTNTVAIETWRSRLLDPKRSLDAVLAIGADDSLSEDLSARLEQAEEMFNSSVSPAFPPRP